MTDEDKWKSARLDFENRVLPELKKIGKQIGEDARAGNERALEIINKYVLLCRSFDPMTLILLEKAIEDYKLNEKP